MRAEEHRDSYDRLCREVEAAQFWTTWGPLVRVALWLVALVAGSCLWVALTGQGCGDVAAEPEPARVEEVHPAASQTTPPHPDAEAFALAGRMLAWQPTWVARHPGELEVVAGAIVTACRRAPWPDGARCPYLLGALTFRESSWRVGAIGARNERGLGQLHGIALAGESPESAHDPDVNLRLTLAWLQRSAVMCRLAGHDTVEAALSMYGSGRCRVYRGASLLLRWEAALRGEQGI